MKGLKSLKHLFTKANTISFFIVLGFFCLAFTPDSKAELTGHYLFEDNLQSSVAPAPPLMDLGSGSFSTDTVNGQSKSVFDFNEGEGLRLDTSGVIPNTYYTIVALFKFDDMEEESYYRILDFQDFSTDQGLYVYDFALAFYNEFFSDEQLFSNGNYVTVVFTRLPNGDSRGYVNGQEVVYFDDSSDYAIISNENYLTFFQDDSSENSPGSVACIAVFDTVLSAQRISKLDCVNPLELATIPTLSEMGLIAMALVLGVFGLIAIRRKRLSA